MKNLHRLMGATFQHAKPGLCERCAFCQPRAGWEGYCTARGKVLSYKPAGKGKPRCEDFSEAPPSGSMAPDRYEEREARELAQIAEWDAELMA